jgi:NTE family protein
VRLTTPLAPAIHLGARRIVAVSTRYDRSGAEAATPQVKGYPPPAQIGGILLHSIFLDQLDHDAYQLERTNRLLGRLEESQREGLRHIGLVVMRPSVDLGKLASEYADRMPPGIRFLSRGLGAHEIRDADFLSLLLFQEDYVRRVIAIGEEDVERQRDAVLALVDEA